MSPEEIQKELNHLVKKKLRYDGPLDEGELAEKLDSVQRLTLVVAIEDHFRICFDPDDEQQIRHLDDLLQMIGKKLEEA